MAPRPMTALRSALLLATEDLETSAGMMFRSIDGDLWEGGTSRVDDKDCCRPGQYRDVLSFSTNGSAVNPARW